jgi:hypothetical protein
MRILGPVNEFKLRNRHGPQPPALHHLGRRQTGAPAPRLFLRQVRERAVRDFQRLDLLEQLDARCRRETVARARGVDELAVLVIADDERTTQSTSPERAQFSSSDNPARSKFLPLIT